MSNPIYLLDSEQQAATSIAQVYPDQLFAFVTQSSVVDGYDLPNVQIVQEFELGARVIPLGGPISAEFTSCSLQRDLNFLQQKLPDTVLPTTESPVEGAWIVKGDQYHKPDALDVGESLTPVADDYGCGLLYQRRVEVQENYMIQAHFVDESNMGLVAFRVISQANARIEMLLACETVEETGLIDLAKNCLMFLGQPGHYSLNVVASDGEYFLTSVRQALKAVAGCCHAAGIDLLAQPEGIEVGRAGVKMIGDSHYSEYGK